MSTVAALLALEGDEARRAALDVGTSDDEHLADLVDELALLVQQDSRAAAGLLEAVSEEARRRGLIEVEAKGSYLRARAEVNQGHLEAALDLIDRARGLWIDAGALLAAWRTDLGRMHVLDDLGRHGAAVAVGEALIDSLANADLPGEDPDQIDWLMAAAAENVGVGHGYLGHHEAALRAYAAAEQTYRRIGMDDEVLRPMANRGVELLELGRPSEALQALEAAAGGFEETGDRLFVARCLAYQARAHVMRGSYVHAAVATQRASGYLDGQETTTDYARIELVRAQTLASLNLLDEALNLYDTVIPKLAETGLRHDQADALLGRAVVLARGGAADGARQAFERARALYEQLEVHPMAATASLGISELSDPDEARRLAEAACAQLAASGRAGEHAAAVLRLAQLAPSLQARRQQLDALAAILDDHDLPHLRWRERHERGRLLVVQGDLGGARVAFEEALSMIDALRSTVPDEHHRLPFMAGRSDVLDDLLAVLLEDGDLAAAYALTDRARARTLVERLSGEVEATTTAPSSVELDDIYTQLLRAADGPAGRLRAAARDLERRSVGPMGGATGRSSVPSLAAEFGVTPVVTYQAIGDELMAFVHRGDELTVVRRLASADTIRHLLARLDAQWRRFDDAGLVARQHRHLLSATLDLLQRLYLSLVAPLPDVAESRTLLVVPCEPLANVPFAALHDGTAFLVERLAVTVTPSVSVARLAAAHQRHGFARRLAVGVGDAAAPNVADEIAAVAAAARNATVLEDSAATVAAVQGRAPAHDVLHLACHGIHRPDSPLFSALRLGDRWLTAAEVAGFRLDGQLVVLSACSSGRQDFVGTGDELVGLPRAFLAAGAGSVIVNLWQVADESSVALMTNLHRELERCDPAEALRRAQLDLVDRHPYYWAPAVLFGAPHPKETS